MEGSTATPQRETFSSGIKPRKSNLVKLIAAAIVLLILLGIGNRFLPLTRQQTMQKNAITPAPTGYKYDTEKAKTLLTQYVKNTVKPEFIPTDLKVIRDSPPPGSPSSTPPSFTMFLNSNISAKIAFEKDSSKPVSYFIFIQPKSATESTTASQANSLISTYFIDPYIVANCQTKGTATYCENFQTVTSGKKGYGIMVGDFGGKTQAMTYSCFTPKESLSYKNQESCIPQRP